MYPTTWNVKYASNLEYQNIVKQLFGGKNTACLDDDDDEIDNDDIDDNYFKIMLDYVYAKTNANADIMDAYRLAAKLMGSEDAEIGMAVLFSYDYFGLFHLCLCQILGNTYDSEPTILLTMYAPYVEMMGKLNEGGRVI